MHIYVFTSRPFNSSDMLISLVFFLNQRLSHFSQLFLFPIDEWSIFSLSPACKIKIHKSLLYHLLLCLL